MSTVEGLLEEIRNCRLCEKALPLGPRPVIRARSSARILIIGQAPGTKVHETGIPWNDPSGERLREWMGLEAETFYDENLIAIMPMGLCYPGRLEKGGDAPPRPECAPLWHEKVKSFLPEIRLTLLVGQYAQGYYLGARRQKALTKTVLSWREYLPDYLVTPHPSWRSAIWLKKNPWFEEELVPYLQDQVRSLVRQ
ncbi:uracil-DNA glycosylase family protein [Kiloniella laminariae]|uniref:Uracil-DNA glycosylase family protein n=1 Tax=Kiloniella laminariae TaxID=454162 RepID=A0ABT4LIU4_9PROT|nr:uracil-DNA glycosylase family protein [Kiloniella laminariae]MCZ4281030.1 uracil-DNA glycosylase family protein [Kiloniella laminariae]